MTVTVLNDQADAMADDLARQFPAAHMQLEADAFTTTITLEV